MEHARLGEPVGDPKRLVDSVSAAAAPLLNRRAFADDDAVGRPGDITGRPGGWLLAALSSCAAVRTTTCAFFLAASSSQTRATARRFRLPLVHGACPSPPPARIQERSDIVGFFGIGQGFFAHRLARNRGPETWPAPTCRCPPPPWCWWRAVRASAALCGAGRCPQRKCRAACRCAQR